uniref:Uncharacterized protein n=1 Tax=Panagrolaimus sp. ES5 TaxID=591445 RepID=A0AC34F9C5_9BILA
MRCLLAIALLLFDIFDVTGMVAVEDDENRTILKNKTLSKSFNHTKKMLFEWPRPPPKTPQDLIYSRYYQGNYVFEGKVKCFDFSPLGLDCKVVLMEYDDWSGDDYVTEYRFNNGQDLVDGRFKLSMKDDFNDWPTPRLELYLEFQFCCMFWTKYGGFLKNGSHVTYTLREGNPYADIYA